MHTTRILQLVAILTLGLLIVWTAAIVTAGPPEQEPSSAESGAETPAVAPSAHEPDGNAPDENGYTGDLYQPESTASEPSGNEEGQAVAAIMPATHPGDWPDENGYAGPPYLGVAEAGEPSASEPADSSPPNWDQFFTEPQPDQDAYYQGAQDVGSQWSGFYFRHVAGSALRPRASTTGWNSDGSGGCIYSSGSEVFNIHLEVPQGSRVDYLRIYYYDASSSDSQAWITRYNDVGGFSDRTSVTSSGNGGYGTALSGYLGEVFDYANYSYVLNWRPNQVGNTMQLCGLRVAYRLPD